ncbi:MAG: hypothetical protein ABEL76_09575 [Bradymonadaceae bacterium]
MTRLSEKSVRKYVEAACVVWDNFHDSPPVHGTVEEADTTHDTHFHWEETGPLEERSHNDEERAREDGAYAVAFVVAHELEDQVAVKQLQKGTGADFLIVPRDGSLNEARRLEVSGTASETVDLTSRLRQKLNQIRAGQSYQPGTAIVVDFREAEVQKRDVYP